MKAEIRKKQILDCAKSIFSEKGYYDTQVEDIIKLAHIGKGTIYQYFRNKEDVFLSLLERFVKEWEEEVIVDLEEITKKHPYTHPAINYLYQIVMKTLRFFRNDHDRGNIILRVSPGLNIGIDSYISRFEGKIISSIMDGIRLGQKFNNINSDVNIEVMANILFGGALRVAYTFLILEKNKNVNIDLEILAKEIVYNMHNGIFNFQYREKNR